MITRPKFSTITRTIGVLCATSAAVVALATPALAAPTGSATGSPAGLGPGYANVLTTPLLGTTDVYSDTLSVEGGAPVVVYCLDSTLAYDPSKSSVYTAGLQSATGITNVAKASFVAANSNQIATPLVDTNSEAVAVQLAIWHLTGGLDYSAVPNADIVARANALVAAAQPLAQGLTGATLTASTTQSGTKDTVTATLVDPQGQPLANQTLIFSGPTGPKTLQTDVSGHASVTFDAVAATESVTWNGQLPAGTVLVPPGQTQRIVTSQATPITRSATVDTADVTTTTTTTTPPTSTTQPSATTPTTAPPTTPQSTTPTSSQLPYTGTWVHPYYLIIAALVALAAVLVRRKLRQRA
jgi:hypothetical protein